MSLLSPLALLLALAALPVLAVLALGERRAARVRAVLGLGTPGRGRRLAAATALFLVAALTSVAAARPVVRDTSTRSVRTDAEALFLIDISRSMLASASPSAPTRLQRAKAAALALRAAIPDVPAGVASFTDRTLPNLFPTADESVFAATVERSVGIDRPPPGGTSLTVTTYDALATVPGRGFLSPSRRRHLLVVLTDAESRDFDVPALKAAFTRVRGLSTVLIRIGSSRERVFGSQGLPEADYHPGSTDLATRQLVAATGARVFGESARAQAEAAMRLALGRGPEMRIGRTSSTTYLAEYFVLAAFAPLGLLLWLRNRF